MLELDELWRQRRRKRTEFTKLGLRLRRLDLQWFGFGNDRHWIGIRIHLHLCILRFQFRLVRHWFFGRKLLRFSFELRVFGGWFVRFEWLRIELGRIQLG